MRKTSLARAVFTREHRAYWNIWLHGRQDAERYAADNADQYLKFQSFWPSIMDGLWGDISLASMLEHR